MPSIDLFIPHLPISNPVLIFGLVMVVILLVPLLFDRLRLPGIVGLIISGMLMGPYVSGALQRDDTFILLGTVGILYLMFIAGIDVDLNQFTKFRSQSIGFGLLTFLIPQISGAVVTYYVLDLTVLQAILLASMFASHTMLAYPIAGRLGISDNRAVVVAVGGTIIANTGSLMVLAVIANSVTSGLNAEFWLRIGLSLSFYMLFLFLVVPKIARLFFLHLGSEGGLEYVFVLAMMFLGAYLAELAGLVPIIGAFLTGLSLNRLIPRKSALMNRIQFIGNNIFIPFFLISVGMLIDPISLFASVDSMLTAGTMIASVVIAKWLAAKITQTLLNFSAPESGMIFGLSVDQAAATLAAVLVGVELGIFDDTILNGTIAMIMVTCLIGPWAMERYARIVALQEKSKGYHPGDAPLRILVPLANPQTANNILDLAFMLREKASQEPLYPLAVAKSFANDSAEKVAESEQMLSHAVFRAASADVPISPLIRIDTNVANGIRRAIDEMRISSIVIGWNGHITKDQQIFGSVLDQLLRQSWQTIMVCKLESAVNLVNKIIVAIPPYVYYENGFPEVVKNIKMISNQISADLFVYAPQAQKDLIADLFAKTQPSVQSQFNIVKKWPNMPQDIRPLMSDDSMLILISARNGALAWRSGLDALPRRLSQDFPDNNFITIYASEIIQGSKENIINEPQPVPLASMIHPDRILLEPKPGSANDVFFQIMHPFFKHQPMRLDSLMWHIANDSPNAMELSPGMVLYHSHITDISAPMLFFGISVKGLQFEQIEQSARLIIMLLSPQDLDPKLHLLSLSSIAHLVRQNEFLPAMQQAQSAQNAYQKLLHFIPIVESEMNVLKRVDK